MEEILKAWTAQLANGVEVVAAVIIGYAAIEAVVQLLPIFVRLNGRPDALEAARLRLGRWLALALEFELAADIVRTAVAPNWTQIGQLAAIATIRTLLNYFLQQEIERAAAHEGISPITGNTTSAAEPAHAAE
jgi:uncharacterized membrane protein